MVRAFKHRRQKNTRILFSANVIPSDIPIEEVMEIIFGAGPKGNNKAAEAAKIIVSTFKSVNERMLTTSELSKLANSEKFSRGQFYNVIHDMVSLGIIRRTDFGDYELSTDFSSALVRMAESYRNSVKEIVRR
ncbi:MAG TPA: hypothetical protein VI933_00530 [archaeon]|nr:hypothetical protein [archaeon]